MNYSVALTSDINTRLNEHLLREDCQEDLCFALWYPSKGEERTTALLHDVILPIEGEREVHGNASFSPKYFERVLSLALKKGTGIAFLHSHLGPGWQNMSRDDVWAEYSHAPAIKAATGFPLVGLTLGTDGAWSARFWEKDKKKFARYWCQGVRVIGDDGLNVTYADHLVPPPQYREQLKRTISAWGIKKQQDLARLKIGVVGAGSVGSIIIESLARMGVQRIAIFDFDKIETHNLDRLLHGTANNVGRYKVKVAADSAKKSATAENFDIQQIKISIVEESAYRKLFDCDVLFSCVDRPWPRNILNYIAYAHLIPVVDGGISIKKNRLGELQNADWKAHAVFPTRRCLECLGQYDPGLVQMEREGHLDSQSYIDSLDDSHALKRNENVFPFSLNVASLQVMQMLSFVIRPLGIPNAGEQNYHFVSGTLDVEKKKIQCGKNCLYNKIVSMGDHAGWQILRTKIK